MSHTQEGAETMSSREADVASDKTEVLKDDEEVRCFICKGFLSCSPLRVLQDGNTICGRCVPESNEPPVYRNMALEKFLKKVKFPCRFENNGCLERVLFGHVVEHETACEHQRLSCFALPVGTCDWKGQISEVIEHFSKDHSECSLQENEFKLNVEENNKNVFVFQKDAIIIVIHYEYNSDKMQLTHSIRYISANNLQSFYKVQLYNGADRSTYVTCKQNALECYQSNTVTSTAETILNMKPYLEILGNPNVIVFSIDIASNENAVIDYYLLAELKCSLCGVYVTPPICRRDSGQLICSKCSEKFEKYSITDDDNLEKIAATVNYPCRWQQCKAVKKVNSIREHENECPFREFYCPVLNCYQTYKPGAGISHFDACHNNYTRFTNEFCFLFKIINDLDRVWNLFTEKGNEIIVIECTINEVNYSHLSFHLPVLPGKYFTYNVKPSTMHSYVTVYFEHIFCRARTEDFSNSNKITVTNYLCCCQTADSKDYKAVVTVK